MSRVLVIGYGNTLRGDDGLGVAVAELIAERVRDEAVQIETVHQLTPELAVPVSRADLVIFVDASVGEEPGSWKCRTVQPDSASTSKLGHHLTPSGLLAYAQALFKTTPRALLISVVAGSFECGESLTEPVRAALPVVVEKICGLIAEARGD